MPYSSHTQPKALRFGRLTVEDGLPNPSVLDIAQDGKGFIWLATPNGIVRYDGYEMKYYYPSDGSGIGYRQRDFPRLYVDKGGGIWLSLIMQRAKLFRYDPNRDRFSPMLYDPGRKEQAIQKNISDLIEDRRGRLLVKTFESGLYALDIQNEIAGGVPKAALDTHLTHGPDTLLFGLDGPMAEDGAGRIWIPAYNGLYALDPETDTFEHFQLQPDAAMASGENAFFSAYWFGGEELWIGSVNNGLLIFNLEDHKFRRAIDQEIKPGKMARAWNGQLWMSVNKGGFDNTLAIFAPAASRFTEVLALDYPKKAPITAPFMDLLCDNAGDIWASSWQNGVYKFNYSNNHFQFLQPHYWLKEGLRDQAVLSVTEDSYGHLWIGSLSEGLARWDRESDTFLHFPSSPGHPNSLSSNQVFTLAQGKQDYLWVATTNGIDRLHIPTGTVRRFQPFAGKTIAAQVTGVFRSKSGAVWLHAWGCGFCRVDDEAEGLFTCFTKESWKNSPNWGIGSIAEDEQGRLWLGQYQSGLYCFDPKTRELKNTGMKLGVQNIQFDARGYAWLTTHSMGLQLFDPDKDMIIPIPDSLQAELNQVTHMIADERGHLWIYVPDGLVEFNPEEQRIVRRFNRNSWMTGDELWFDIFSRPALGTSGELFFPSRSGLLYFHPDSLRLDTTPPKLVLTDVQVFGKSLIPHPDSTLKQSITYADKLELNYRQDDFTLFFAALHYKYPQENRYSFKLEPYEKEWSAFSTQRDAHYTNMPPGSYSFYLRATNSDGVPSAEVLTFPIIILPPWYATWWARSLFALLALTLLYTAYRFQLSRQLARAEARRLAEMDRFKTNFFTNITHEFRTPLTLILGLAEELQGKASEATRQRLAGIRRNGQQLLRMVNQLLALSRLEADSLPVSRIQADVIPFLKGIFASFESAARQKGVAWEFQTGTESLLMDFDPEKLQSILSNLLSNALKFTPAGGRVKVEVGKRKAEGRSQQPADTSDLLHISVADTGIGIAEEQLPYIFDRFYSPPKVGELAPEGPSGQPSSGTPPPWEGAGGRLPLRGDRGGAGAGIGLALVKELVKLLDGHIEAKSQPGKGSEFIVTLPIRQSASRREAALLPEEAFEGAEGAQPESAALFESAEGKEQPLALVVDDNPEMAQFITGLLQERYRVIAAANGAEGMEKARKWGPDAIVSDVMMPEMDGMELCRRLKQDERTSHIPIILLTARADEASRIEGLEYGADAYLTKPFGRRELLVRLEQLIALRRRLRERFGNLQALPTEADSLYGREREFIMRVQAIIHNHLSDNGFDVHALCRELGMARTPLHNKLKALTGRSSTEYIRAVRLQHARKLLLQTALPISDIAYQTGFSNPNYFSTRFKEEFGLSPSRFRQKEQ